MLAKFLFTTVPGSIIFAAILISTSILVGSGYLKIDVSSVQNDKNAAAQGVQDAQSVPEEKTQPAVPDSGSLVKVNIKNDPVLGDKDATLVLVEFSDYECPFCKKAYDELLPEIKKNYIDTGKLKLVYKDLPLPFHKNAAKEAEAALCAEDQGGDVVYYKYHDKIFTTTEGGGEGIALGQLPVMAGEIGLNILQFKECLDSNKFKSEVDEDVSEASRVGATGTPTWFLGKEISEEGAMEGIKIVGAQPFSEFKKIIDKEVLNN